MHEGYSKGRCSRFGHDYGSAVVPRISQGGDPPYQEMPAPKSVGLFNDLYFFSRFNPGHSFD